jgi:hypothetical protein
MWEIGKIYDEEIYQILLGILNVKKKVESIGTPVQIT